MTKCIPHLSAAPVAEVEREILRFFEERAEEGFTIVGESAETPSEWFVSRIPSMWL
jgi:hypothetical protein